MIPLGGGGIIAGILYFIPTPPLPDDFQKRLISELDLPPLVNTDFDYSAPQATIESMARAGRAGNVEAYLRGFSQDELPALKEEMVRHPERVKGMLQLYGQLTFVGQEPVSKEEVRVKVALPHIPSKFFKMTVEGNEWKLKTGRTDIQPSVPE